MARKIEFLYNKDIKEKFLEETKEVGTKNTYVQTMSILQNIEKYETRKRKSIFDMSKAEILDMLVSWQLITKSAIDSNFSIITKYVLSSKLSDTNGYNAVTRISVEDKENCIDKESQEKKIVSIEMYYDYLDREANTQDKALMILLWNGISGKKLYSDIINLKASQYDSQNATITMGDKVYRFTEKENEILKLSQTEPYYVYYTEFGEERNIIPYLNGTHFIRNVASLKTANNEENQVSHFTVSKRLNMLFRKIEAMPVTGDDFITSGVLHRITEEYDIRKLTNREIYDIAKNEFETISANKIFMAKKIIVKRLEEKEMQEENEE